MIDDERATHAIDIARMRALIIKSSGASGSRASCDLVEGRVGHLIRLDLRRTLYDLLEHFEHIGICATGIRLCVFFLIPHTDANRIRFSRSDEHEFVLGTLLLSKHGNEVLVEEPSELRGATRFEMERNSASKHVNLPGWLAEGRIQM